MIVIDFPSIIRIWEEGRDAQREDAKKGVLEDNDLHSNGSSDFEGHFGVGGEEVDEEVDSEVRDDDEDEEVGLDKSDDDEDEDEKESSSSDTD